MNTDLKDHEKQILYRALSFVMEDPNVVQDLNSVLEVKTTELDLKLLLLKLK